MRFTLFAFIVLASLVSISCGKNADPSLYTSTLLSDDENSATDDSDSSSESSDNSVTSNLKPNICSDLNFDKVTWPTGTNQITATLFGLAMNMSGSFEGHEGWENLSNNFDGQGVSLGLFNQNLGQGSLQTLLLQLLKKNESSFKTNLTSAQFTSMTGMLKTWNGGSLLSKASKEDLDVYDNPTSSLDDPELLDAAGENLPLQKASSNRNQASVNWAVQNLYSGSSFKAAWKNSLQNLASTPAYVSVQIQAAKTIHNRAIAYMTKYNLKEMRSYLFFFDIVVQNGSLTSGVESKFATWLKTNAKASETAKLKKLLEYRLTLVKSVYVKDVRARKTAIIDGVGTVHGSKRDFKKEYCGPSWSTAFTSRPTLK